MNEANVKTPAPVMGIYDRKMWETIAKKDWHLQCCSKCGAFQYPPAPGCSACLSMDLQWQPVSGNGRIISWTIFHKQYLPAYPAPYNVIAVRLEEGPVFISNLEGPTPAGSWIGEKVNLVYVSMPDGFILPRFRLKHGPGSE
jgi:uncharacterized OB-fold protein